MIVVDQVTKYYGAVRAVDGISFRIAEGECVGFLGLNGAGKSTTLKMLSCLLLPTSGRITVHGHDAERDPYEIRKLIGFLPDTPPLYGEMTVSEYLSFAGRLRGLSPSDVRNRMDEVLEVCGLSDVSSQIVSTLSHGYRQRVGIAQAIFHRPALLILDEPIQGLDPVQIVEMRQMIRALRGKHTILLSTHILSEIEQTCDRILMMHKGTVAAEGSEEELAKRYSAAGHLELQVRGDVERIEEVLRGKSLSVDSVEALASGVQKVVLRADEAQSEVASRALVEAGLGLRSMSRVATGLESIFVRMSQSASENQASQTPSEEAQ